MLALLWGLLVAILILLVSLVCLFSLLRVLKAPRTFAGLEKCTLLVVLGSGSERLCMCCSELQIESPLGGHTSEMFRLLDSLSLVRYEPRIYYVAQTDAMSTHKLEEFESKNPARQTASSSVRFLLQRDLIAGSF